MKNAIRIAFVFVLATNVALVGQESANRQTKRLALTTTKDQASHAFGLNIGRELKANLSGVNAEALIQGIRHILSNAKPSLTREQCDAALKVFQQKMQAQAAKRQQVDGSKNKRDGQAFLAANKNKPGVVTLPSGLQYQVLKSGNGASPKVTDRVKTHYHGTLINGKVFDSSVERNQPATFGVGEVIRGWVEGLQLMKVGDKWRLFVPSELAYGPRTVGPVIGPHSALIFEIELLGIE